MENQPLRQVIKANVEKLRTIRGGGKRMEGARAFAKFCGVGEGTIWRISQQGSADIEILDAIARKFSLKAWHLMIPGLDPLSPPVLPGPLGNHLLTLFEGMSDDSRDLLLIRANRIYSEEHPESRAANPFPVSVPGTPTSPYIVRKKEDQS